MYPFGRFDEEYDTGPMVCWTRSDQFGKLTPSSLQHRHRKMPGGFNQSSRKKCYDLLVIVQFSSGRLRTKTTCQGRGSFRNVLTHK